MNNNIINKIEFEIDFNDGEKIAELKFKIKVNDVYTNDYSYESFNIYKFNNTMESICDMSEYTILNKEYILNYEEQYVIEIEELKINNMKYSGRIWNTVNTVFVNGKEISEYDTYCMNSKYENNESESFKFTFIKEMYKENEVGNIDLSDEMLMEPTTTVVPSIKVEKENNLFWPITISIILVICIIAFILIKIKKKR